MAHILVDRVKETTTTTGTGAVSLAGAVTGYRAFDSVMANGDTTLYCIQAQTPGQWEVGVGTWNTGNTLSRTTLIASSTGGAVNFSAGTKDVFMTLTPTGPWEDLNFVAGSNTGIYWNNAEMGLARGSANALELFDAQLNLEAGTTTRPPLLFNQGGSVMTTPSAGSLEMDATNLYGTTDQSNRGYIPLRHFARTAAGRTLTNTTNEQAIFDPGIDTITLEAGVYRFESILRFTNMSGTSGNARIDWPGAGTATIDTWLWWYSAVDNTNIGPGPLTPQVGWPAQADSAASIATAGTGTALGVSAWGTFDVTVGGTFIPTIDLFTGAAANVTPGSYFMCERMGASDVENVGQWS